MDSLEKYLFDEALKEGKSLEEASNKVITLRKVLAENARSHRAEIKKTAIDEDGDEVDVFLKAITPEEVRAYKDEWSARAASKLLQMYGPDGFAGTEDEYYRLLAEMEEIE